MGHIKSRWLPLFICGTQVGTERLAIASIIVIPAEACPRGGEDGNPHIEWKAEEPAQFCAEFFTEFCSACLFF
jgi:hypothetical protein